MQAPPLCSGLRSSRELLLQVVVGGGRLESHEPLKLEGGPGPIGNAARFPMATSTTAARRPDLYALPLLLLLGFLGLWSQLWRQEGQDCKHHLCCFLSSTSPMCSTPPLLDVQMWELFSILVCWEEQPLMSYRCFTGCRLKGRDKGSISCLHDADITLLFIF